LVGLIVLLYYATSDVPSESSLARVSGELSEIRSKRGLVTLVFNNNEARYGYSPKGGDCGNLHERLAPYLGQNVVLLYDQNLIIPLLGANYYQIYELKAQTQEICSFARISAMEKNSRLLGCMFGVGVIVFALFGLLRRWLSGS
jgi:hypothetical protein